MYRQINFSCSAQVALTSSYANVATLTNTTSVDSEAEVVPDRSYWSDIQCEVETIAGGATSITYFLAADSAGDIPITHESTVTLVIGVTTATKGGFGDLLQKLHSKRGDFDSGKVYVFAKTNSGTCNATFFLNWGK